MDGWRQAAAALTADLKQVFTGRLRSVVAYGPHIEGDHEAPISCLALVDSLELADLDECSRLAPRWERQQLATPLVVTTQEFGRSLDAFPLEYNEILRAHQRVFGRDPFDGVTISRDDLRRACETQIKSHLVHLRENYIESRGRQEDIRALVHEAAPGFAVILRRLAHLDGFPANSNADLSAYAAKRPGLDPRVVGDVLALAQDEGGSGVDGVRLYPAYLAAVERLWHFVDRWRAESGR